MTRIVDGDRTFRRLAAHIAPHSRLLLVVSITTGALVVLAYIGFATNLLPRTTFVTRLVWLIALITVESCVVYWFGELYGPRYEEAAVEDDWLVRYEYPQAVIFLAVLAAFGFLLVYAAW